MAVLLSSYHGAYRQTAPAEVSGTVQRDMRCSKNIIAFGVFFKCRKYKEEADQRASLLIPLFLTVGSLQVLQEEHKKRTGPYWCFQKVLSDCSDSWFKVLLTRNDACVFNSTKMIFFFPSIFFFHKFFWLLSELCKLHHPAASCYDQCPLIPFSQCSEHHESSSKTVFRVHGCDFVCVCVFLIYLPWDEGPELHMVFWFGVCYIRWYPCMLEGRTMFSNGFHLNLSALHLKISSAILLSCFWVCWDPFATSEVIFILITLDSFMHLADFGCSPWRLTIHLLLQDFLKSVGQSSCSPSQSWTPAGISLPCKHCLPIPFSVSYFLPMACSHLGTPL